MSEAYASDHVLSDQSLVGPDQSARRPQRWVQVARAFSLFLGFGVLALAALKAMTGWDLPMAVDAANSMFGPVFMVLYLGLVALALGAWFQGRLSTRPVAQDPWWEAGVQAASGIATLALTFTLLGISIGIGGLSGTPLSPETVPDVIATLTEQFGRAFMTTIVGLPTSHALRALLAVNAAERRKAAALSL